MGDGVNIAARLEGIAETDLGIPCLQESAKVVLMLDVRAENQILIVGAGPSGLALAAELKRRGVDVAIVDQQPAGANTSRACVVHARTMEVLEPLGVIRDLLAEGVKVPVFCVRDRNRSLLTVDFSDIPSFYRFTLMIPQNRIEQILLQHLEGLGCNVVRPCRLIRYVASPSLVEAQLNQRRLGFPRRKSYRQLSCHNRCRRFQSKLTRPNMQGPNFATAAPVVKVWLFLASRLWLCQTFDPPPSYAS